MKSFTAVVERDPETRLYVGYIPGFPGAHSQGMGFVGSCWPVPGSRLALDAETVEGEGGPGAVAEEPLAAGAV